YSQSPPNGWAIGHGEEYTDLTYQDDIESRAIYDLLEQEVVPMFYTRSSDDLPRGWLKMMKASISTCVPFFNTNRMVQEYMEKAYWPSAQRIARLSADNLKRAAQLARWRRGLQRGWSSVRVESVDADGAEPLHVGGELKVRARVNLGGFTP